MKSIKTNIIKYISIVLQLSLPAVSYTETIHLSGTVIDEYNSPVKGAEVTLYLRNSMKTNTDAFGGFELSGDTKVSIFPESSPYRDTRRTGNHSIIGMGSDTRIGICLYDFNGRKLMERTIEWNGNTIDLFHILPTNLTSGLYLISVNYNGEKRVFRSVLPKNSFCSANIFSMIEPSIKQGLTGTAQVTEFNDILVVTAAGKQTVRRAVTEIEESAISIKLMSSGVNFITPTIPVFTDKGGIGDVTTYGSVSDPEYSQGGACNYGSTKIRYYAAINVNQVPGDGKGDWQDGHCCGRCARVRVRGSEGEERTTVVRIVDRCADANCGIDLGGAPAGVIMKDQPGRYSGEWEWVNCDDFEEVSDGPPSIYIKEGSNEWWSLVQVRNGSGSVSELRVRKVSSEDWRSLEWATEAENFFQVPPDMLQDSDEWDIKVVWNTGTSGSLRIPGKSLAIADTSYTLQL